MGYDNLKLEKGMYRQEGMSFTQVLESLDPSENYRGTALPMVLKNFSTGEEPGPLARIPNLFS